MGSHRTAAEVRQDYVAAMGPELGELIHALSNELTWVHWKWSQYRLLYGDKPSRIDLMNEAAAEFFGILDGVLFEDTVLGIARLIGAPKSAGKAQLTIQRLPPLVADPASRAESVKLIDAARSVCDFAVDWRNRHIAHRDLQLSLGQPAAALTPASRKSVEDALAALREVLNQLERAYCKSTTSYTFTLMPRGAEALLHVLHDGVQRARERSARWDRGEHDPDDARPADV